MAGYIALILRKLSVRLFGAPSAPELVDIGAHKEAPFECGRALDVDLPGVVTLYVFESVAECSNAGALDCEL